MSINTSTPITSPPRIAVRAIIVRDEHILVQKKVDASYTLPGGAPNPGETLEEGLQRECQEEIGTYVTIKQLRYVADYFKPRLTTPPSIRQQTEILFTCLVDKNYIAHNGTAPDKRQVDVLWLPLAQLSTYPLRPKTLVPYLQNIDGDDPVYIGCLETV